MKKIKLLVSVISGGVALLSFSKPVNAALDLCGNQQGVNATGLCGLNPDSIIPQIVSLFLYVAFVAALLYLIYGGIRWITSGGDKEGTGKAKGTVTAALIGLAIVIASWIVLNIVITFFGGAGINSLTFPKLL